MLGIVEEALDETVFWLELSKDAKLIVIHGTPLLFNSAFNIPHSAL